MKVIFINKVKGPFFQAYNRKQCYKYMKKHTDFILYGRFINVLKRSIIPLDKRGNKIDFVNKSVTIADAVELANLIYKLLNTPLINDIMINPLVNRIKGHRNNKYLEGVIKILKKREYTVIAYDNNKAVLFQYINSKN